MLDQDKRYPLGATRIGPVAYAALLCALLGVLLVLDRPVAAWAGAVLVPLRPVSEIVTIPGDSVWTLVPALIVLVLALIVAALIPAARRRAFETAAIAGFVFVGVGLPGLVSNLVKQLVGRARPVHLDDLGAFAFRPFSGWDFQSFPSGDTTTVFAGAAIILFFFPRLGWIAVAGAALVGFARIALGVHYPSDVYGGLLLGTFGAYWLRNFCVRRGWIFVEAEDGRVVRRYPITVR